MIELEFLSGRDKGKSIRPSSEKISIGRAPDNTVVLQNPHVSSHHGIIVKRGATYIYEDLGSTNGSLVRRRGKEIYLGNDTQRELPLLGGDEIRLGAIPEVVKLKVRMRPGDDALGNGSSTIIATCSMDDLTRIDESLEKHHEILLALYRYTKEIQGLNSSREIHEALCHSVFQIFPQASHLSVILWDEKKGDYEPIVSKVRRKGSHSEAFQLSRSLIQRVIERKEAVLFEDARQALGGAESVISGKILSSICVPLTNQEGLRGMLQVDNRESDTMFKPKDLEVLTILGNHTATLLSNIELFEDLKDTLHRLEIMELAKCHMAKFVPTSVRKIIEEDPKGLKPEKVERNVTVMFLDICGYTKMSEAMGYERLNHIVEHYFSAYLDEIHSNGGDINETAGDGLMIIYQGEHHARDAVRTAVQIQRATAKINFERSGEHDPVFVNIGINSGMASVGLVRFEGLTGARWTYTASGTTTNHAARMAAHAEEGEIIIGTTTKGQLNHEASVEDLGKVTLKNVSKPVQLYRVAF